MIRYYLVNQEAVASNSSYIRLLELAFGIEKGRLIVVSDKNEWAKQVLTLAQRHLKTIEANQFESRLRTLVGNSIVMYEDHGISDTSKIHNWDAQAKIFAGIVNAIISTDNDKIKNQYPSKFIAIEDLPPKHTTVWDVEIPHYFPAQPEHFASLLEPIFRASTGECLYIIDPYFNVYHHSQSLDGILETAVGKMKNLRRVEIHIGNAANPTIEYIKDGWIRHLNQLRGIFREMQSLVCCCWEPEVNHQRYVITKHGGLQFDAGIIPRQNQQTSAIPLRQESANQIIAYYNPNYNYNNPHHNNNNIVGGRLNRPTKSDDIVGIVHYGDLPQHFRTVTSDKLHRIQ